jgi:hypothetical protein
MTKEGNGASFTPELLGGVPEAFVQTALLAGGIGLWEWPVGDARMALSPYLETLLGYPSGGFDGTKFSFLARLNRLDVARVERVLADAIERGGECDVSSGSPTSWRSPVVRTEGTALRDLDGRTVRLVGTMRGSRHRRGRSGTRQWQGAHSPS